ncbi:hypothetical protein OC834_006636, partial [Tilletia horrida]
MSSGQNAGAARAQHTGDQDWLRQDQEDMTGAQGAPATVHRPPSHRQGATAPPPRMYPAQHDHYAAVLPTAPSAPPLGQHSADVQ